MFYRRMQNRSPIERWAFDPLSSTVTEPGCIEGLDSKQKRNPNEAFKSNKIARAVAYQK